MSEQTSKDSKAKVLIIAPAKLKPDTYMAIHAIATSYKSNGKQIELAVESKLPEKYTSNSPLQDVKIINKLPEQKFLIQFPGQKGNVKSIQWNQNAESMNIYITMQDSKFVAEDMKFNSLGAEYEEIIFVGVTNLQEIGSLYKPNAAYVFEGGNNSSVGATLKAEFKVQNHKDDKSSSISEDAYKFLKAKSAKVNKEVSSSLLAGIFAATSNFKTNIKDPQTYITCANLLQAGATNEDAQAKVKKMQAEQSGNEAKPESK